MSRREEVEEQINSILRCAENFRVESNALQHLALILADEADDRDAIIDKLLAMLEPGEEQVVCRTYERLTRDVKSELHARACEIAGRKS